MTNWISVGAGILTGYFVLLGLYFWLVAGDVGRAVIMFGAASSLAVLVGSAGIANRRTCRSRTR